MPGFRCAKCGFVSQQQGRCKNCGNAVLPAPADPKAAATITRIADPPSGPVEFADSAELTALSPDAPALWVHCSPLEPLRLDGEVTIGRGQDSDLVLPHMGVSRNHAFLRKLETGEIVVIDNGSANGVLVNGERVATRVVKVGDRIRIGPYEITLKETKTAEKRSETKAEDDDETIRPKSGTELSSTMLMGKIGKISFAEILQYVDFHKKTGKLSLRAPDGTRGELVLANGKPLRASFGPKLKDEEAVRAMLAAHSGTFAFDMDADLGAATMKASLATLLLDFSRKVDEHHSQSEPKVSSEASEFFQLLDGYTARRNPNIAEAKRCNARGFEAAKAGNLDGAIADFTKALEVDPSLVTAWYNRGLARERKGEHKEAIIDYSRAIALEPEKLTYWLRRGIARGDSGDYEGALADCTKVLSRSPFSAPAYTTRSCARRETDDLPGAIDDATRAINLDPRLAMAWCHRGLARYKTGDKAGCIEDFKKYLELSPNGAHAPNVRALLEQVRGR